MSSGPKGSVTLQSRIIKELSKRGFCVEQSQERKLSSNVTTQRP